MSAPLKRLRGRDVRNVTRRTRYAFRLEFDNPDLRGDPYVRLWLAHSIVVAERFDFAELQPAEVAYLVTASIRGDLPPEVKS